MADYSLALVIEVPLGGRAVANIETFDEGQGSDITSITAVWADNNGVTLNSSTYTVADITTTDIYGNAVTLTNPAGTGTYSSTLVIDLTNYTPPVSGLRWTLTVTAVKSGVSSAPVIIPFFIVPSSITVSLDQTAITAAVARQVGFYTDTQHVAKDTNAIIPLRKDIVYGIVAGYKNGSGISQGTDYAWQLYRPYVTVSPAPAVGDVYTFTLKDRSDTFISDTVRRFTEEVLSDLQPFFDTTALMQSPTVIEIVKQMVIGQVRMDMVKGPARDSATFQNGMETIASARNKVLRIQRGSANIHDTAGNPLSRTQGSVVGHYSHPDGDYINRLGLLNRGEAHTGFHVGIVPNPILNVNRRVSGE